MRRRRLFTPCEQNARLMATTSERESLRINGRVEDLHGRVFASELSEDDNSHREFDRMMRGNRGVL